MARKNKYDYYSDDNTGDTYTDDGTNEDIAETFDSNGNQLHNGDSVILIKDLKIKGSPKGFKRGDVVKNIKLTNDPEYIDVKLGKSTIALKTCFVKKK